MNVFHALRLGLRSLTRTPGFFALALVTLSLGIGATTVLFSITESVLWRPFSFSEPERLVELTEFNPKVNPLGSPVSAANFLDWRQRSRSFERLAAMTFGESHSLTGSGERVRSTSVSAGFFETLRVPPATGRTFTDGEERSTDARVVVLTDAFWRSRFDAAADVLGRQVKLDGERYTVVGVLPADFRLEFLPGVAAPDLFLPLHPGDAMRKRNQRGLMAVGRLKDGVSAPQAAQEMSVVAIQLAAKHPEDANWTVNVENLRVAATKFESRTLFLFLGFACLVLLIACANVAGLQLVRFTGRQKEYALRLALGARRGALLRQALAENAWIAIPGGVLGALLASWGVAGVRAVLPAGGLARSTEIAMGVGSLAFVLALSLGATLLFALAPALLAWKLDLDRALRAGSKGATSGPAGAPQTAGSADRLGSGAGVRALVQRGSVCEQLFAASGCAFGIRRARCADHAHGAGREFTEHARRTACVLRPPVPQGAEPGRDAHYRARERLASGLSGSAWMWTGRAPS